MNNLEVSKLLCIAHHKDVCLYCEECQDVLCAKCLVEKHQGHAVKEISDAVENIKEKVEQWCSKQSLISRIKEAKDKTENLMTDSKRAKITTEEDLRQAARDLKTQIEEKANLLCHKIEKAFQKHHFLLQCQMDDIMECGKSLGAIDANTTLSTNKLQLYLMLQNIMKRDTEIDKLQKPKFCFNTDINVSIGFVKPDPDETGTSQVATVGSAKAVKYWVRIDIPLSQQKLNKNISKIVPVGDENAWVIMDRKLYRLNKTRFEAKSEICADDFVLLQNGDLVIMQPNSLILKQMHATWITSLFTRTNPYHPQAMTYLKKNSNLMVLLDYNTVMLIGLNGIVQKRITLQYAVDGHEHCLIAVSPTDFSIAHTRKGQVNGSQIVSYSGHSLTTKFFSGVFGCDPHSTFICKSICYDDEDAIVVSDYNFNTIYRLNKEMKMEKILIDKLKGPKNPSAVAYHDGILWVADTSYIYLYKYSEIK